MNRCAPHPLLSAIGGRTVALLGLGVSHLPLAELLVSLGVSLKIYDKKPPAELGERALFLEERGVPFVFGDGCFESVSEELILRSPGLRPDLPALTRAVERGATLTSETELLLSLCPATTFGITGSDGKTTSTTLTGLFLRDAFGHSFVGGNIGTPLLPLLDEMTEASHVVLELSSFQLMTAKHAPQYVAVTNLSPNHLDWHKGMDEYAAAKRNIVQESTRRLVTNADCEQTAAFAREELRRGRREVVLFSSHRQDFSQFSEFSALGHLTALYERDGVLFADDGSGERAMLSCHTVRVPGRHNLENYMTAIGLTLGLVPTETYTRVAEAFTGVEHRLEWVRSLDGVDYYNSSIDSSPTRTAAALSALNGRSITVICGGYDKKIPFAPLAEALCRHAHAVVLTGATASKIQAALDVCPAFASSDLRVQTADTLEQAVRTARALAEVGGCVLLSPACASFDAFRNFAERGNAFKRIVLSLDTEN